MKKVMGLLVLLGCIAAFSWYAGVFEEDVTAIEGGEEGNTDSTAHGGRAAAALGKMGKIVCTTGMTGARIMGVAGSVSSLVGAGLYTCSGENRPAGKLGVVAFYSFLLYMMSTRMDIGLCAML